PSLLAWHVVPRRHPPPPPPPPPPTRARPPPRWGCLLGARPGAARRISQPRSAFIIGKLEPQAKAAWYRASWPSSRLRQISVTAGARACPSSRHPTRRRAAAGQWLSGEALSPPRQTGIRSSSWKSAASLATDTGF